MGIRISSLPPPLVANDNHVRLAACRNIRVRVVHRMDCDRKDVCQQEEGSESPGNFHPFAAEILSRLTGTRTLTKPEGCIENKNGHQHKDGHHYDSQDEEQMRDRLREAGSWKLD
jgi:hypothetical protein